MTKLSQVKEPSFFLALFPIIILVGFLSINVVLYGDMALSGANQMALLLGAAFAVLVGFKLKYSWHDMFKGILESIQSALPAILILLMIGALAGTWMVSGIVPTMIYYGLKILNPTFFLFAACMVSAIVSLATGSSWSTVATVGVALLGIGTTLGIHNGIVAGAIISGAYFGDKISPLSDTTNLAPAMAGTDLFTHIRYMMITTIPTLIITLIIFLVIGFTMEVKVSSEGIDSMLNAITSKYYISPVLFIVPAIVIFMIIKKVDALPALFVGAILGAIAAAIFQPKVLQEIALPNYKLNKGDKIEVVFFESKSKRTVEHRINLTVGSLKNTSFPLFNQIQAEKRYISDIQSQLQELCMNSEGKYKNADVKLIKMNRLKATYIASMDAMTSTTGIMTSNDEVNNLLKTKGMSGMLNTIWLIVCAMSFGGAMEACGLLQKITRSIVALAKSTGSLIATTASTCLFFNATASDQYLAIVVPGRMFASTFKRRGLKPENLSRTLEDSGTVTSVLFPWNTCGATQASVLGVATGTYWMYCFFNILSPIITVIVAYLNFKITRFTQEEMEIRESEL